MPSLSNDGLLAQLVEQLTFNQLVAGSIPAQPTTFLKLKLLLVFIAKLQFRVVSSVGRAVDF